MTKMYKATNPDMKCLGFQYRLNETHVHKGKVKICESGFHACPNMADVINYYKIQGMRIFEVDLNVIETEQDKAVGNKVTFHREVPRQEYEEAFKPDSKYAWYYAIYVLKSRWKEAEPLIMKHHAYAYYYAGNILNNRWIEAEPFIMKDPEYAYYYAKNILKSKWEEAEPYIRKGKYYSNL